MDLIARLAEIVGPTHVLTGAEAAGFGREWTCHYTWTPMAVVRPGTTAEVSALLQLAHETGTKVVPVGGNTGLNGGTFAEGALMISLSRLNRVREINPAARVVVAEAGVVLETLHDLAAQHDLAFPLTFGAKGSAMVGGFLSTNAGGSNVVRYGSARALCLGLEVVLADGRIWNGLTGLHKDNTGYDLRDLMIGAEGTLGIITAAVLKLTPAPTAYATALIGLPSLDDALTILNAVQKGSGGAVEAFEYMPDTYMERLAKAKPALACPFPPQPVNVLIETATTVPGADPVAQLEATLFEAMEQGRVTEAVVAHSTAQRRKLWEMRETAAEITFTTPDIVDCDIALPLDLLQSFLDRMTPRLMALDPQAGELVIGHLGDGNLHYTAYPSRSDAALGKAIRAAVNEEAMALNGSFSAEHGVGISKRATMAAHKDPVAVQMMAAIKAALDPKGILNPGKVLP
ncbi:FAD/FMN-containing dehydrogenase [Rhodobacter aestuarii]|uniref:FAD/FMN-containing dehydrogenase n=1 Tax=Rhodobacter aestuarii TaxID=453582 RepID=A0A1N7PMZ9_9RHOB|nr:FAD-binding oxidoreductase [Rhodobacter aestuarii]PTV94296.1 FAD/FMN-containing dehydrogenase [Rhodobacter aestuarii]SIT11759.1 FAD/FMN-containing dehydrogenase [Rhodobacter aestuarii]